MWMQSDLVRVAAVLAKRRLLRFIARHAYCTSFHLAGRFKLRLQTSRRAQPPAGGCGPVAADSSRRPWPQLPALRCQPPCLRQQFPRLRLCKLACRQWRHLRLQLSRRQRCRSQMRQPVRRLCCLQRHLKQPLLQRPSSSTGMSRNRRPLSVARQEQVRRMLRRLRRRPCSRLRAAGAPACRPCRSRMRQHVEAAMCGSACRQDAWHQR